MGKEDTPAKVRVDEAKLLHPMRYAHDKVDPLVYRLRL